MFTHLWSFLKAGIALGLVQPGQEIRQLFLQMNF